jgi:hypothetical protein
VNRLLAMAMVVSLAVSVFVVSGAQSAFNGKAFTTKVTAKTTPKRDRRNPFVFTTKGKITPPTAFCGSTAAPTQSRNCIPLDCPAGATNTRYCVRPGLAVICRGKVNIRIQRRGRTISSRNVNVRSNCAYTSNVTLRLKPNRRGSLKVRARFAGNTVLRAKASSTATVRAG